MSQVLAFMVLLLGASRASAWIAAARRAPLLRQPALMVTSQLEQLASMTVLSVDTGDLDVIAEMAKTGFISDATTNPLFVSQAGLSGDPRYSALVDAAVEYATMKQQGAPNQPEDEMVGLAMDKLAVKLGTEIIQKSGIKGYVSTEVDPRLSFDTVSLQRTRGPTANYHHLTD